MTPKSPLPWRAGTKVFRTLYDDNNRLIGVMDHPEDAAWVVKVLNERDAIDEGAAAFCAAAAAVGGGLPELMAENERLKAALARIQQRAEAVIQTGTEFSKQMRLVEADARAALTNEQPKEPGP